MKKISVKPVKKIFWTICIAACLLLTADLKVNAGENASVQIDQAQVEDGKLVLYVNHNQGEKWQINQKSSAITIADQQAEIESIDMLKKTETPISYVCMVDVSGSMSQERIDAVKGMLYQFVDGKREQDNFYITLMGDNLVSSDILQNADEIKSFVDGITVTKEDTNLYQSIKEELAMMQNEDGLHTKKCLIIFSDGAEDQSTGITREEAETAVRESNIPVFTVAMLKNNPTEAQIEEAKVLGSFARYSPGGQHLAPVIEEYGNEEVYPRIQNVLDSSLIVKVCIKGINITENQAEISATFSDGETAASGKYELSSVATAEIMNLNVEEEDIVTEVEEERTEEKTNLPVILLVVGGALVAVIIVSAVVIKIRKERLEDDIEFARKAEVSMISVMEDQEKYDFTIKDEVKIGRGRRCQLCIKDDAALSEVHCSIQWRQGELLVKDENSTNGTYVNGVPIVGEYKLEQGDVLLIGSYEYRITWR